MQSDEEEEEVKPPALTVTVNANGTTTSTPTPLTPEEKAAKAEAKAAKEAAEKVISDEKARVREVRVKALLERLRTKIAVFTEQAQGEDDEQIASGVKTMWAIEAEELKDESYGVELLQTVGFVYASKSRYVPPRVPSALTRSGTSLRRLARFRSGSAAGSIRRARRLTS